MVVCRPDTHHKNHKATRANTVYRHATTKPFSPTFSLRVVPKQVPHCHKEPPSRWVKIAMLQRWHAWKLQRRKDTLVVSPRRSTKMLSLSKPSLDFVPISSLSHSHSLCLSLRDIRSSFGRTSTYERYPFRLFSAIVWRDFPESHCLFSIL
jgi:hypothetical protein